MFHFHSRVHRFLARKTGLGLIVAGVSGGVSAAVLFTPPTFQHQQQQAGDPRPDLCSGKGSPFLDPELEKGIERRRMSAVRFNEYMAEMAPRVQAIEHQLATAAQNHDSAALEKVAEEKRALKAQISVETQRILYGVSEPGARQRYLEEYGCARWTTEAIAALSEWGPLVEIGAGAGHWQRELTRAGVVSRAFDSFANPHFAKAAKVGEVQKGNVTIAAQFPDHTLFLCYPPPGDMAWQCLQHYRGNRLAYVGEGRGGANANGDFFALLEQHWMVEQVIALKPFPQGFEKLWMLRRRQGVRGAQ
mmetsp:Transcript_30793/g.60073  ORF Transcript_30793/g.60073 Transcript_30793/m.60073 type:complete len:304 (-) Transcript_30793:82-993(-)